LHVLVQVGLALALAAVCALVHAGGLTGISWLFNLEDDELERKSFSFKTAWLVPVIALSLFLIHLAEIGLFAAVYAAVGATGTVEDALYFSISSYTTAGSANRWMAESWRLLGGAEALAGFLLIGWSTAYLVQKLNKLRE
jgi:energy-converting hydrogenase Eha subunit A